MYARQTTDFIDRAVAARRPFFAYLSVYAPHHPATPAPQDARAFPGLQAPRDSAYDQADVRDGPQFVRQLPPMSPAVETRVDRLARPARTGGPRPVDDRRPGPVRLDGLRSCAVATCRSVEDAPLGLP